MGLGHVGRRPGHHPRHKTPHRCCQRLRLAQGLGIRQSRLEWRAEVPLIQLRGVTKTFGSGEASFQALRGVDFCLATQTNPAVPLPSPQAIADAARPMGANSYFHRTVSAGIVTVDDEAIHACLATARAGVSETVE